MPDHPTSSPLVTALDGALGSVQVRPEDAAAVALARRYAEMVDAVPDELVKVGPLLLATLTSLGMTPAGRAAVLGKGGGDRNDGARKSAADELRERRAARQRDAEAVD